MQSAHRISLVPVAAVFARLPCHEKSHEPPVAPVQGHVQAVEGIEIQLGRIDIALGFVRRVVELLRVYLGGRQSKMVLGVAARSCPMLSPEVSPRHRGRYYRWVSALDKCWVGRVRGAGVVLFPSKTYWWIVDRRRRSCGRASRASRPSTVLLLAGPFVVPAHGDDAPVAENAGAQNPVSSFTELRRHPPKTIVCGAVSEGTPDRMPETCAVSGFR